MKKLMLFGLATLMAGCGPTMKVVCDGNKIIVPRDCDSTYATEVEEKTRAIDGAITALQGALDVKGGFLSETRVKQLSEQFDQLTASTFKQHINICKAQQTCGLSSSEAFAKHESLYKEYRDAELQITTVTETVTNAMADDEAAAAAVDEGLAEVEATFAAIESLLKTDG